METKDSGLIPKLYSERVIELREKEELNSIESPTRRIEKFLSLLGKKSVNKFQQFLSALDRTGQQHIADEIRGVQTPAGPTTGFDVLFYCINTKVTFCRSVKLFIYTLIHPTYAF